MDAQPNPKSFLDLSAELRNDIYRRVVVFSAAVYPRPDTALAPRSRFANTFKCYRAGYSIAALGDEHEPAPLTTTSAMDGHEAALLQTNRQIRREAQALFYGENTFGFHSESKDDFRSWASAIGNENTRHIRSIQITHYVLDLPCPLPSFLLDREDRTCSKGITVIGAGGVEVCGMQERQRGDEACSCEYTGPLAVGEAHDDNSPHVSNARLPGAPGCENKAVNATFQFLRRLWREQALVEAGQVSLAACEVCGHENRLILAKSVGRDVLGGGDEWGGDIW